jgi:hypothetical protein
MPESSSAPAATAIDAILMMILPDDFVLRGK